MKSINRKFFERSAVVVAKDLIGCFLCTPKQKYMIVETEAYEGLEDRASHASKGETARNKIMFGPAGYWYVYFTYGLHYMLNIVCGLKGHPAAVLIRGVEAAMGPACLTKKLGIDKKFNGKKASPKTGLWIEPKTEVKPLQIISTPRIGVDYSGPIWSRKHYRFVLKEYEAKKFRNKTPD